MKKYWRIFEITPGGWLLLSVLYFFADLDEFLIIIMCVLVHEMGHLFMLELFGLRIRRIELSFTGMTIFYNDALLYGVRECFTALCGPLFGLIVGVLCSVSGNVLQSNYLLLFAGGNIVLSLFNLLPAKPLDGWRCIHALFPFAAQIISVLTALVVLVVGIAVMYGGYGISLAIMGIILLLQDSPHNDRRKRRIRT